MLNLKLRIMFRAIKVRLEVGEELDAIFASYPKLTGEEQRQITEELNKEAYL